MKQLEELSEKLDKAQDRITEGREISAEHLAEWKQHPITQLLSIYVAYHQIDELSLIAKGGIDAESYAYSTGVIDACEDLLTWEPEMKDEA